MALHPNALLHARASRTQAVEQCRANLADLRTAVKAANSHREKCAELLGAATEAVVALEFMLYDPNIDLPRERALQSLASRVQTAMDQVRVVVPTSARHCGLAGPQCWACSGVAHKERWAASPELHTACAQHAAGHMRVQEGVHP